MLPTLSACRDCRLHSSAPASHPDQGKQTVFFGEADVLPCECCFRATFTEVETSGGSITAPLDSETIPRVSRVQPILPDGVTGVVRASCQVRFPSKLILDRYGEVLLLSLCCRLVLEEDRTAHEMLRMLLSMMIHIADDADDPSHSATRFLQIAVR